MDWRAARMRRKQHGAHKHRPRVPMATFATGATIRARRSLVLHAPSDCEIRANDNRRAGGGRRVAQTFDQGE
jgi:hypothetical protein